MVNLEQVTRRPSDRCKLGMMRRWLNTVGLLSKAICGLFLQSFLFSHTGQIHGEFKAFVKEQIKQKLVAFEGDAKASKTRSVMKWWSKCISVAIAKTASRNVAFKIAKMREAIMEDQDEFLMRNSKCTDVDMETNTRAQLEDVGQNADLYIANQGANSQS